MAVRSLQGRLVLKNNIIHIISARHLKFTVYFKLRNKIEKLDISNISNESEK